MIKNILRISFSIIIMMIFIIMFQIYSFNNRSADNLSSYCNIDFIGIKTAGIVNEASLEIVDLRYFSNKLSPEVILVVDNEEYHYLADRISKDKNYQGNFMEQMKDKNSLRVLFDENTVGKIKKAGIIKFGFKYEGDEKFKIFQLSDVDLIYWKNQL